MTFLSRQEIINKGLMFLMCTFFLFPSLVFAGDPDSDSNNIGHDVARIKVMVNRPHYKEVDIIHDINDKLLATYSKYDKMVKIWDKQSHLLLSEYHLPIGEIEALFSNKMNLFAKSKKSFYKIDLSTRIVLQLWFFQAHYLLNFL